MIELFLFFCCMFCFAGVIAINNYEMDMLTLDMRAYLFGELMGSMTNHHLVCGKQELV